MKVGVQGCSCRLTERLRSCVWDPWCELTGYGIELKINACFPHSALFSMRTRTMSISAHCCILVPGIYWVVNNCWLSECMHEMEQVGNKPSRAKVNQSMINPENVIPWSCDKEWGGSLSGVANSNTHRGRASNSNEWTGLSVTIGSGGDCGELGNPCLLWISMNHNGNIRL